MKSDALFRFVIIAGLSALTLVPLYVANTSFFPFITGKNFAFRIGVDILFALWAMLALRDTSVRPKPMLILYVVGAFVLSLGISAVLGVNFDKSFWSNFERMEGWIGLFHLGLYFFLIAAMFQGEKAWKYFFNTTITVSVLIGLFGFAQLAGFTVINQGGVRVDATLGNATYLAVYMLFHLFITALAAFKWGLRSRMLQLWYGAAFFVQAVILYFTATRGTILGLIVGIFVTGLVLVFFSKGNAALKKYGAAVLIGVVLLIGGFLLIKDTSFVRENETLGRLASISLSEGATRFTVWGMAFQGFLERPIFGWGQENFNYVFNQYYEPSLYAQEPWFDRAHNVVLDWLIAGGLIGFLLYLSVYAVTFWYLVRPQSTFPLIERALIAGLIVAHAIHNLFVFDNLISYLFFLTIIAYVAYQAHDVPATTEQRPSLALPQHAFIVGAPIIIILLCIVVYFVNVPGIATATGLIDAIRPQPGGAVENFENFKALSEKTTGLGRQEVREQLIQFALQVLRSDSPDQAFKQQVVEYAIEEFKDEIANNPEDARLRLFLGSLYRQIGLGDQALAELTKALKLSPQKLTTYLELGVLYHDASDISASQEWFRKALELEPRYDLARSFYAVTAIESGDDALLKEILLPRYGTITPDNDYILQAYVAKNDAASIVGVLESRVEGDPENADARLQLASAYVEVGNRQASIEQVRKVIELRPDFKEQGEGYIRDIEAGLKPQ